MDCVTKQRRVKWPPPARAVARQTTQLRYTVIYFSYLIEKYSEIN